MTGSGIRWALAIVLAAYATQAAALVVWLAWRQRAETPIPPWEIVSAAQWIPFYAGAAAVFAGGYILGRFKAFDEALNLAMLSAGLCLALDVTLSVTLISQAHPWDGVAYSFLAKAAAGGLGVLVSGSSARRR